MVQGVADGGVRVQLSRAGFTLIELLLVVALLGVMAGVVAPRVATLGPLTDLQVAARTVVDNVRMAQAYAVNRGQKVSLKYEVGGGTMWFRALSDAEDAPAMASLPGGLALVNVVLDAQLAGVLVFPSGYVTPHRVVIAGERAGELTVWFDGLSTQVQQVRDGS